MKLRAGLGDYVLRCVEPPVAGALTMHDLGELFRRAGHQAGFVVESEYRVDTLEDGTAHHRKVDWVWLASGKRRDQIVVAFEIEGTGVPKPSLRCDLLKFSVLRARLNVIALYQVNHDRRPFSCSSGVSTAVSAKVSEIRPQTKVRVVCDVDVFRKGGIEQLMEDARKLAATRRR